MGGVAPRFAVGDSGATPSRRGFEWCLTRGWCCPGPACGWCQSIRVARRDEFPGIDPCTPVTTRPGPTRKILRKRVYRRGMGAHALYAGDASVPGNSLSLAGGPVENKKTGKQAGELVLRAGLEPATV